MSGVNGDEFAQWLRFFTRYYVITVIQRSCRRSQIYSLLNSCPLFLCWTVLRHVSVLMRGHLQAFLIQLTNNMQTHDGA